MSAGFKVAASLRCLALALCWATLFLLLSPSSADDSEHKFRATLYGITIGDRVKAYGPDWDHTHYANQYPGGEGTVLHLRYWRTAENDTTAGSVLAVVVRWDKNRHRNVYRWAEDARGPRDLVIVGHTAAVEELGADYGSGGVAEVPDDMLQASGGTLTDSMGNLVNRPAPIAFDKPARPGVREQLERFWQTMGGRQWLMQWPVEGQLQHGRQQREGEGGEGGSKRGAQPAGPAAGAEGHHDEQEAAPAANSSSVDTAVASSPSSSSSAAASAEAATAPVAAHKRGGGHSHLPVEQGARLIQQLTAASGGVLIPANSSDPCLHPRWEGIVCDAGEVVSVDLSNNGLKGRIPQLLSSFSSSLRSLNLAGNSIQGGLEVLCSLPALRWVSLQAVGLEGRIPSCIGHNLPLLEVLELQGNRLTGPVPDSLANLKNLVSLQLYPNAGLYISSTLASHLSQAQHIKTLSLPPSTPGAAVVEGAATAAGMSGAAGGSSSAAAMIPGASEPVGHASTAAGGAAAGRGTEAHGHSTSEDAPAAADAQSQSSSSGPSAKTTGRLVGMDGSIDTRAAAEQRMKSSAAEILLKAQERSGQRLQDSASHQQQVNYQELQKRQIEMQRLLQQQKARAAAAGGAAGNAGSDSPPIPPPKRQKPFIGSWANRDDPFYEPLAPPLDVAPDLSGVVGAARKLVEQQFLTAGVRPLPGADISNAKGGKLTKQELMRMARRLDSGTPIVEHSLSLPMQLGAASAAGHAGGDGAADPDGRSAEDAALDSWSEEDVLELEYPQDYPEQLKKLREQALAEIRQRKAQRAKQKEQQQGSGSSGGRKESHRVEEARAAASHPDAASRSPAAAAPPASPAPRIPRFFSGGQKKEQPQQAGKEDL